MSHGGKREGAVRKARPFSFGCELSRDSSFTENAKMFVVVQDSLCQITLWITESREKTMGKIKRIAATSFKSVVLWFLRRFEYVRELERVEQDHRDYILGKATIEDIATRNGAITLTASTEMVQVMAAQMAAVLDGHDAENYVEMQMNHRDGRRFAVIVQRCEGKTPHEKRKEAEDELKRYLAAAESREC